MRTEIPPGLELAKSRDMQNRKSSDRNSAMTSAGLESSAKLKNDESRESELGTWAVILVTAQVNLQSQFAEPAMISTVF